MNFAPRSLSWFQSFKNHTLLSYSSLAALIIAASFFYRTYNLNYNSPFNDEAAYIIIGKLGLFSNDWFSYNASSWMAGSPYIYPLLTALAYNTGGIIGSRFLNIIFGTLTIVIVVLITQLLSPKRNRQHQLAAAITATLISFSVITFFISRLATHDIPSYYFLFLSLYLLLLAETNSTNLGKLYFFSSISLTLAALIKIISFIYLPPLIFYSFIKAKGLSKNKHLFFWRRYFLTPLTLGLLTYLLFNFNHLVTYTQSQLSLKTHSSPSILNYFWFNFAPITPFLTIGSLGLAISKQKLKLLLLTFLTSWILVPHLLFHRLSALEKHLFFSVAFTSIIAGLGISSIVSQLKTNQLKNNFLWKTIFSLVIFIFFSLSRARHFNSFWINTSGLNNYLTSQISLGDKVLTETGAAIVLANYPLNHPTNTTTFDWSNYQNLTDLSAYQAAVKDGYFNFIQLETSDDFKSDRYKAIRSLVKTSLDDVYTLVYSQGQIEAYQRTYD